MLQLRSLRTQADALKIAFDEAIKSGKTLGEVRTIYFQIKQLEKTIYERKIMLQREGRYNDDTAPEA